MSHQNQFAHVMKHGLSRTNRFEIEIPLPPSLQAGSANTNQQSTFATYAQDVMSLVGAFSGAGSAEITRGLNYMVEQTELPGRSLTTTEVRYNGDFYKIPYSVVYAPINFTFRVSRDMHEKNTIDDWIKLIFDPFKHEVAYMDDYCVDIRVTQLDEQENRVHTIVMKDAFPVLCDPLPVSNEEMDNFHRLNVQFMYRRWHKEGDGGDGGSGINALSQSPLGPVLNPILQNPAVKKGLEVFERNTGVDLEGEAVNIYNQVNDVVENTTGSSINKSVSMIEGIRSATESNNDLSNDQKTRVLDIIDETISKIGS